ncbi:MAG: SPOR domain-containing protein [Pseudomonadota bacterium]
MVAPRLSRWIAVVGMFGAIVSARADEALVRSLAERDLVVAPEVFAAETMLIWRPGTPTDLAGPDYRARLPRQEGASQVLIGGPGGAVIADLAPKTGPLAISSKVAAGLKLTPGQATALQVVALKPLSRLASVPVPSSPAVTPEPRSTATPISQGKPAPLPPTRPVSAAPKSSADAQPAPATDTRPQASAASLPDALTLTPVMNGQSRVALQRIEPQAETPVQVPGQGPQPANSVLAIRQDGPIETPSVDAAADANPAFAPSASPEADRTFRMEAPSTFSAPEAEPEGKLALQAGYFGIQANAVRLSAKLTLKDLPTVIRKSTLSQGDKRWTVLVGPFQTAEERRIARIRGGDLLKSAIERRF